MKENVFFAKEGEKGITRTSATHLCALAAGVKKEAESFLNNISFINESISIVGSSSEELPTSKGTENLEKITSSLSICSDMNAFINHANQDRSILEDFKKKSKKAANQYSEDNLSKIWYDFYTEQYNIAKQDK